MPGSRSCKALDVVDRSRKADSSCEQLCPHCLSRRPGPQMKVGFFLHTPFPSSEIYRTLPVREEVRGACTRPQRDSTISCQPVMQGLHPEGLLRGAGRLRDAQQCASPSRLCFLTRLRAACQVLRAVLAADLVGFHTYDYARHFISSCTRILGLEGTPEGARCTARNAIAEPVCSLRSAGAVDAAAFTSSYCTRVRRAPHS